MSVMATGVQEAALDRPDELDELDAHDELAEREQDERQAVVPILAEGDELAPGYRVLSHLRRGDALDVYEIWSAERECRCVAKTVRPDCVDDQRDRRRVLREGRLLRQFTHPHIVRAYEVQVRPIPFVILETLTGATLKYLIADATRRLSLGDIGVLGLQLCSAVSYLHRHNILHLDLKPSNIIACQGTAKVIDLSLARRPCHGHPGIGTRAYMAPEQARGGMLTPASDIWGIGAVLYEAASGEPPFAAYRGRRYDQLERRADPLRTYRRVPAAFAALVDSCLDPEPKHRPTI